MAGIAIFSKGREGATENAYFLIALDGHGLAPVPDKAFDCFPRQLTADETAIGLADSKSERLTLDNQSNIRRDTHHFVEFHIRPPLPRTVASYVPGFKTK
jgi:hypothetical protein